MIGVIWRTPRNDDQDSLYEKFKVTPGIVASYQLKDDHEVLVVTIWESAEKRDEYARSALQGEVNTAFPTATRSVYEVTGSTF